MTPQKANISSEPDSSLKAGSSPAFAQRWVVFLLFFLSGFTGLVYEIAWSRILSTILGNTSLAITVVVSIFLAGLAFGSFLAPRFSILSRSPLTTYACLELFIGAYSVFTPYLSTWIDAFYGHAYDAVSSQFWLSIAVKAFMALLLFGPPSIAMGATLPVLVRCFSEEQRRHRAGQLYGINTAGAVIGTLSCGYLLLPLIGIKATIFSTGAVNLLIGALAFALARKNRIEEPHSVAVPVRFSVAYLLVFMTGFSSLAYEILCARALSMFFGSSVYAFSSILAAFLLGIAFGSSYYSNRIPERADPYQFFSLVQFRLSLAAIFFVGIFMGIPYLLIRSFQLFHGSFPLYQTAQFLLIGTTVFYATFISGAAFPAALHFFRAQTKDLTFHVANIYTFNTIGSIAGSICAGFLMIPLIGVERSIRVIGLLNLVIGIACFRKSDPAMQDRKVLAIGGVCLVLLLVLPQWNQSIYNSGFYAFAYKYAGTSQSLEKPGSKLLDPIPENKSGIANKSSRMLASQGGLKQGEFPYQALRLLDFPRGSADLRLIYYGEGLTATVAVVEQEKQVRSLLINGKPDASNVATGDMRTQLLLGHLPVLLKGSADRVLVIGLGSGVTSGALVTHRVQRIDCVEIEKKVSQAARFFENENLRVLDRKIFRLILDDGRNYVRHNAESYDVITSEPSNLWMSGVANLFTQEFFASAKSRLNPGGVMCQWIHLYQISLRDVLIFLKTFHSVFPHLSIWIDDSDMLVMGAERPLQFDPATLARRMSDPAVAWSLRRSKINLSYLKNIYVGHENMLKVLRPGIPLNVDDHPILEFSAPKSVFLNQATEIRRSLLALRAIAEKNKL